MKTIALLFSLLLLTGCVRQRMLVARSEYLDPGYLASRRIETPDPCQGCFVGQQIVVSWSVPSRCLPADIDLRLRYGNRCFSSVCHTVDQPQGFWIYRLLDDEFWELEGIVAYSATLSHDDHVIDQWNHHIWADLIEVPYEEDGKPIASLLLP